MLHATIIGGGTLKELSEKVGGVLMKLINIRQTVEEELRHIPRGNEAQNLFRQVYNVLRLKSLGRKASKKKTKEEVFVEAIREVRKIYPDFFPEFDEEFFNKEVILKLLEEVIR